MEAGGGGRYAVAELPGLVFAVHDGEELAADAYVPDGPGPFPGLLLLHGGAFTKGSRSSFAPWGRFLAGHGYVAMSADYRLARPGRSTYPEAIWDVRAAVQFMRGSAATLRLDSDRLGVMGTSAGGYLAAMVALTASDPQFANPYPDEFAGLSAAVTVAVPMAGNFDLIARWRRDRVRRPASEQVVELFLGGSPSNVRRRYYEASPLFHASEQNASGTKWLIAWGTHDEISPPEEHSIALADELSLAGALVRLVPLVGAPHFWGLDADVDEPGSYGAQMAARLLAFLRTWCRW